MLTLQRIKKIIFCFTFTISIFHDSEISESVKFRVKYGDERLEGCSIWD